MAKQTDNIINHKEGIPKWMNEWKLCEVVLCQKDPSKGNAIDNYRPISCFPLISKLMAGTIAVRSIYNFLDVSDKLSVEQKGCRKKRSKRPFCSDQRSIISW